MTARLRHPLRRIPRRVEHALRQRCGRRTSAESTRRRCAPVVVNRATRLAAGSRARRGGDRADQHWTAHVRLRSTVRIRHQHARQIYTGRTSPPTRSVPSADSGEIRARRTSRRKHSIQRLGVTGTWSIGKGWDVRSRQLVSFTGYSAGALVERPGVPAWAVAQAESGYSLSDPAQNSQLAWSERRSSPGALRRRSAPARRRVFHKFER
jgi:hypothetical protein